jgi:cytidine deaminase
MRKPPRPAKERNLVEAAVEAARNSHSPYSHFRVGAALLTDEGLIFCGCNVENASYGLTICAERAAMATAVSAGHRRFSMLAIAAGKRRAVPPCGACLQVLAEFCGPRLPILLAPLDDPTRIERVTLRDLLPKAFSLAPT